MTTDVDHQRLPTGTVTFMFTDVEESTRLVQAVGSQRFANLIESHYRILRSSVADNDGTVISTEGDSVFAVFVDPLSAMSAALRIQSELASADWGGEPLRVRIGIHTGSGVLGGDNYVGVDVHKASRISDAANGGQIVISEVTAGLLADRLPDKVRIVSLGRYRLSGFAEAASLHQLSTDVADEFPPLRAQPARSQLPVPLTEFVGRSHEIDLGLEILAQGRLMTLTGPGGTGKTRLSLEIARQAESSFPDGAYFVPLASVADPSLIAVSILDALKLKTAGGVEPLEHILRFLSNRTTLVVLDNFEQLVEGAAVLTDVLSQATGVSLIVTSRAPLRIAGERELPVPPLQVPDVGADASLASDTEGTQLFVKRATAVRPDFRLDDRNVNTVAAIVRTLDGLPLAIELAASRLRSLTPELVLERLGNKLLKSQSVDLPARQQTIVNAIGWSYDLLNEKNRLLFEKLSVFSGTFGLDEMELICGDNPDPLDGVTELVEQSLVRQTESAGQPRFRMLTVIREFAYAALAARGSDRETLDRHATVYADLAEKADSEILTSRQQHWLGRLADEHDNMRSAFDHSVDAEDSGTALRIAGSMWRFWQMRGHLIEGRERLETAVAMAAPGHEVATARALIGLGGILYWQGKWAEIGPPYTKAVDLMRAFGSDEEISEAVYNLSFACSSSGDYAGARSLLNESLELSERIGRSVGVGRAYWGLGDLAVFEDDLPAADEELRRAVEEFSKIDAPFDLGWTWFMLGQVSYKMGRPGAAEDPVRNALDVFAGVHDYSALSLILELLAVVKLAERDSANTAHFMGAVNRLRADTGIAINDVELNQYPEMNEFLDQMDEVLRAEYDEGYNADLDAIVQRARSALE